MRKYRVTSVLFDFGGRELERTEIEGYFGPLLFAAARHWGEGRLLELGDPNAYVEHTWKQTSEHGRPATADSLLEEGSEL